MPKQTHPNQTSSKRKLFSVTLKDCRVDCFTVGGNGGGGKDTSNTGVRVTHIQSGAVGKATDTRSQAKNKALAFRRMGESKEFVAWVHRVVIDIDKVDAQVEYYMRPQNIKVEGRDHSGKWVELDAESLEPKRS